MNLTDVINLTSTHFYEKSVHGQLIKMNINSYDVYY